MDFRKNAKHLMCDLTTKWILESAQSLACALIYWYYVLLGAENYSSLGVKISDAQKGAACSKVTLYSEGSNASSTSKVSDLSQSPEERKTHSSE